MKKISTILLAVLTLAVTACGGSSGESGDSAQDRAVERYAQLLEGVGAQDVDEFSACVLPVLKDTSGLSWDDIATRLDNSATFEDSEEQFDDVPEPDDKGQATLLACFSKLSEDDLQMVMFGGEGDTSGIAETELFPETVQALFDNLSESGFMDGTDEELLTYAECYVTYLLNEGFSLEEAYGYFTGTWNDTSEAILDAGMGDCLDPLIYGPSVEVE